MLKITKSNGKVHIEKPPRNNAKERVLRRRLLQRIKTACILCGIDEPLVLELHHVEMKERDIGEALNWAERPAFFAEIIKCTPLCANCHKLVHAGATSIPTTARDLFTVADLEREWEKLDDI